MKNFRKPISKRDKERAPKPKKEGKIKLSLHPNLAPELRKKEFQKFPERTNF